MGRVWRVSCYGTRGDQRWCNESTHEGTEKTSTGDVCFERFITGSITLRLFNQKLLARVPDVTLRGFQLFEGSFVRILMVSANNICDVCCTTWIHHLLTLNVQEHKSEGVNWDLVCTIKCCIVKRPNASSTKTCFSAKAGKVKKAWEKLWVVLPNIERRNWSFIFLETGKEKKRKQVRLTKQLNLNTCGICQSKQNVFLEHVVRGSIVWWTMHT